MNKSYIIQWKSKVNGRIGRGTRQFDRDEADRLAAELNREYPEIHHEVTEAEPSAVRMNEVSNRASLLNAA